MVDGKKRLSTKSYSIKPALNDGAAEANSGISVKSRCLSPDLRVA